MQVKGYVEEEEGEARMPSSNLAQAGCRDLITAEVYGDSVLKNTSFLSRVYRSESF